MDLKFVQASWPIKYLTKKIYIEFEVWAWNTSNTWYGPLRASAPVPLKYKKCQKLHNFPPKLLRSAGVKMCIFTHLL